MPCGHAEGRPPPARRLAADQLQRLVEHSPTPSSTPSALDPSSAGTPKRSPFRSVRVGSRTSSGRPSEVESQGSCPTMCEQQRGVGDRARQRTALVERRRERDHPVTRDRAIRRLQADDAAQRRRLADRAARCPSRSPTARAPPQRLPPIRRSSRRARARGPTGCARCRNRSSRSTSPSRTRPCSSCRSSARPPPPASVPRSPCRAACALRGCATRRWSGRPPCRTGP